MPARERILTAAEELFAETGFEATPTSRIAERAGVPKGLVHYYFKRKPDLLVALVERLPDERLDLSGVVVADDVAGSLRRLLAELDRRRQESLVLSSLLYREADTHHTVRDALQGRFRHLVALIRKVIMAAGSEVQCEADVDSAAELLALAVSYQHSVARHETEPDPGRVTMERELAFIADALALGAGAP
ncbi:TetR/AcrR family transcriptional regulator [Kutzneria sp. CA-103260]|uniref:TetR/AcrR family transcriptional regulator n=1 Tax=Kutzneria sp. CA-103260 TaxID=2802641 RepID=UPI001BA861E5|nr:TetR/AcrR family transcriptional regulator [Kutzneria sp. CA-103260]QUQ71258.1 TetR family transcriptional regulator [Kutzneria sp. CA-103260]